MDANEKVIIGPYRGYVRGVAETPAAQAWLACLAAHLQGGQGEVLTQGRHRNVRFSMPVGDASCEVVVKAFACGGAIEAVRTRYRGSKAWRSWLGALHLHAHGIGTPEPLAILERAEGGHLRESYFVAAYLPDTISFADALISIYREEPDGAKLMALLQTVATAVRQMHATGFVHYDLGNQNILLRRTGSHQWGDVRFIDLNRGRVRDVVSDRDRGRDLSRIALPSDFLRVFYDMYFGAVPPQGFRQWERHYRRLYAWHSRSRRWRHPFRESRVRKGRKAGSGYPPLKSIWIWDPLSRQPLITVRRKDRKKMFSWRRHLQAIWSPLRLLPCFHRHYRALLAGTFQEPVVFDGRVGVAVEWREDDQGRTLAALGALGSIPVLVRFCRHAATAAHEGTVSLVRQLRMAGHVVSIALLQDRAAVEQPELWRSFVDAVLSAVGDQVEMVEVGHAINRVKWGIWTFAEYREMLAPFVVWRERLPGVRFGGPAVIDFEYAYIPTALDHLPAGMRFDVLTHHLYVDRRGAPENRQGRFALREKLAMARAIGKAHRNCGDGLIITEFNWPLLGTGIHSPVGAPYVSPGVRQNDPSVSEEDAAAYMLRYILIAIGSGLAERVFCWSLVAHGFGLIDDIGENWRERSAYLVLKGFLQRIRGYTFHSRTVLPQEQGAVEAYVFRGGAPGEVLTVLYTESADTVWLPIKPESVAHDAYGMLQERKGGSVPVTGMPIYVSDSQTGPLPALSR